MTTTKARDEEEVREVVRAYYGEAARAGVIPGASCCSPPAEEMARRIGYTDADVAAVPEGANLGVGCGAPLTSAALKPGEVVLDLGSGGGFDALLAVKEVGPTGRVIGVDMTPEMLERARRNAEKARAGNVEFRAGQIEALPVSDSSVDVVISNCVINLIPDKAQVYREVTRVLRPGGRMVISDVVLDAPLPPWVAEHAIALAGCVAGAVPRAEYLDAIERAGLADIEILHDKSFGEVALSLLPETFVAAAKAANVDVEAVARSVRSLTIRARKPLAGV